MPLMAVAFPILPGKTAEWRAFMDELDGPRHAEFIESRRKAGVHERTFLQSTPMGDLVIVTLEGDDPEHAFAQMMSTDDAFTKWFAERGAAVHGLDPAVPLTGAPSELVADTDPCGRRRVTTASLQGQDEGPLASTGGSSRGVAKDAEARVPSPRPYALSSHPRLTGEDHDERTTGDADRSRLRDDRRRR
jgi:hypothetical protein